MGESEVFSDAERNISGGSEQIEVVATESDVQDRLAGPIPMTQPGE